MKKYWKNLAACFMIMCLLVTGFCLESRYGEVGAVNKVLKKSKQSYVLYKGQTMTIRFSGSNKVKWSIKNRSLVKVVSKKPGKLKIKAKKTGKLTIRAVSQDKKRMCTITIKKKKQNNSMQTTKQISAPGTEATGQSEKATAFLVVTSEVPATTKVPEPASENPTTQQNPDITSEESTTQENADITSEESTTQENADITSEESTTQENADITSEESTTQENADITSEDSTTQENADITSEETTTKKNPTTTEKPSTTKKAITTEKPSTTKKATTTEKPSTTKKATTTEKPSTTKKPTTTQEPVTTEKPTTRLPDTTTETPDTTESPTTTEITVPPVSTEIFEKAGMVVPAITENGEVTQEDLDHREASQADIPSSFTFPTHYGEGTFYGGGYSGGCANLDSMTNRYYICALNKPDYNTSQMAGAYLKVTGPCGTLKVLVADELPEGQKGDIDFNEIAFPHVARVEAGRVPVSWEVVPFPTDDPIQYFIKKDSTRYWMQMQVRNQRYPIAKVEMLQPDNTFVELHKENYNFFTIYAPGDGPYVFRVTDINGQVLVDTIEMNPGTFTYGQANFPY